jgi:hypothetical protein
VRLSALCSFLALLAEAQNQGSASHDEREAGNEANTGVCTAAEEARGDKHQAKK